MNEAKQRPRTEPLSCPYREVRHRILRDKWEDNIFSSLLCADVGISHLLITGLSIFPSRSCCLSLSYRWSIPRLCSTRMRALAPECSMIISVAISQEQCQHPLTLTQMLNLKVNSDPNFILETIGYCSSINSWCLPFPKPSVIYIQSMWKYTKQNLKKLNEKKKQKNTHS